VTDDARIEVATVGDPARSITAALAELRPEAGVYKVSVSHDESCPCVAGHQPMTACTCEIVWLDRRRVR
jgi:hypothetical protein